MSNFSEKKETDNLQAIIVGLFLIILIATITIFKSKTGGENKLENKPTPTQAETIDTTKIKSITPEELAKKIQARTDLIIVDIRDENPYKAEHIIDSINIPSSKLASFPDLVAKNKACILIDASGEIALINAMADNLSASGYKNIAYLAGGFASWKNNSNPTISIGNQKSFTDQAKVKYINSLDLKNKIATEKNLIIIDTRKNTEYATEHLTGAINIFLDDIEKKRKTIPMGKNIILYDNATLGAFKAATRLFDLGFSNTLVLSGGLDGWKINGYTTTK